MRSKDRLEELRQLARAQGSAAVYCDTVEPVCKEQESPRNAEIEDIFHEVERLRSWIDDVNGNTQLIRRLHSDPTFHTNKQLQEQLEGAATLSHAAGLKACGALRQLAARVAAGGARHDAAGRIARLQLSGARHLAADALDAHHIALERVRADRMVLLHRQVALTNLTISDEECQSLLDSNDISLFVDNVRAETAEARRQLRDVEARHAELQRVEAALRDVHALFAQLAALVVAQQDTLDRVELHATHAYEHVGEGGAQLLHGSVSRTRARKKKLGLVVCLVTGFAIVLLVLIVT